MSKIKKFFTKKNIFSLILAAGGIFLVAGTVSAYLLFRNLPNPGSISERSIAQSTKIYDRTGEVLLYDIHGEEKRTLVKLDEIPMSVRQAALAAEDAHFYEHGGLDFKGIARALFKDIISGSISQGGSTITQQLVKKALLTDERTLSRKIKEAVLSLMIERQYSKDQILEWYLNQIPYGSNAYGVQAASRTYFSKDVKDLSLAESAILAAITNAPTYYSPYGSHKDELIKRKNWVLQRMADNGFISKEDAAQAQNIELVFAPPGQSIRAPHFVMYVREYLNDKYGEDFVSAGGLKVITTLDAKLQDAAEKAVTDGVARNEKLVNAKNASLVSIDPKTGQILAMVGSHDYFDLKNDGNVNVALRPRQPGSSFKPFVYAAAFKQGFLPETALFDVFTEFNVNCNADSSPGPGMDPGSCYHPQDYDGKYRGPVTLRQSLDQSLNVPSVKLLYLVGPNSAIDLARSMGISTLGDQKRYGLSLVLGGAEVKLIDMVSAYGSFAQDGMLHPKTSILRVENAQGVVLEEAKDSSTQVMDTEVARTMNDVLSDNNARVPVFSPTSSLYFPGKQVAAKTGTTQDYRDAWTIGYTPNIVAGVWVGNNDNTSMTKGSLSVMIAAPIWHQFMEVAIAAMPSEQFTPPAPHTTDKAILRGLYRSGDVVRIDKVSGKLATDATPPELIQETSYGEVKSILAYVRRGDPLGVPPANPYDDSQYKNWQAGIDAWLGQNPLSSSAPPQGYDDAHTDDKHPQVTFLNPNQDTVRAGDFTEVVLDVSSYFPLQEVQLFINDEMMASKTGPLPSGQISLPIGDITVFGQYTIRAVAYDEAHNKTVVERTVNVTE